MRNLILFLSFLLLPLVGTSQALSGVGGTTAGGAADGVVTTASYDPALNLLTLQRSNGLPAINVGLGEVLLNNGPLAGPTNGFDIGVDQLTGDVYFNDGGNWSLVPSSNDAANYYQDNTVTTIPAIPLNPTTPVAPVEGDMTVQDYSNGVVLSVYNGTSWDNIPIAANSISNFIDLLDTPTDYTGSAGLVVAVNPTESGLEFITIPSAPVTSVFGRTGDVIALAGDYNAGQITNAPAGDISALTVQDAINELDQEKMSGFTVSTDGGTQFTVDQLDNINFIGGTGVAITSNQIVGAPTSMVDITFSFSASFLELTDTPPTFGAPGEMLVVNPAGDGLIFVPTTGFVETITTLTEQANGDYNYVSENGTVTVIASESVTQAPGVPTVGGTENPGDTYINTTTGDAYVFDGNTNTWVLQSSAETLTVLAYNAGTNTLTYTDEDGTATPITLATAAETITTLVDNANGSFTYTSENGTVTTWNETTTSVTYNAGTNVLTFTNEDGVATNVTLSSSTVTQSVTVGNQIASHTGANGTTTPILESITTLSYNNGTNILTYTDEAGVATPITLNTATETITTLVDNANGSFTYTSENGTVTTWNETTTSVAYTPATNTFSFTDEDGTVTNLTLGESTFAQVVTVGNIIGTHTSDGGTVTNVLETVTSIGYNAGTNTLSYTDEAGVVTPITLATAAETITTLTDNANGSFTYISENGTNTTWNETTTSVAFNPVTNTFSFTDEDGTVTNLILGESTIAQIVTAGNAIATHTSDAGTATTIFETTTTLVDNGGGSYTYTNEAGVATNFSITAISGTNDFQDNTGGNIPGVLTDPTVIAAPVEGDQVVQSYDNGFVVSTYNGTTWDNVSTPIGAAQTVTTLTYAGATHTLTYTDENGTPNAVPLNSSTFTQIVTAGNDIGTFTNAQGASTSVMESITTLVNNNDGTWTYTAEGGGTTLFDDAGAHYQNNTGANVPAVPVNPTGVPAPMEGDLVLQAYDNGSVISVYDGGTWVHTVIGDAAAETVTTLTYSAANNQLTYTDENGTANVVTIGTSTVAQIVTVGNAIATHTGDDGTITNILETVTTIVDNGDGTFTFTNENGVAVTYTSAETVTTSTTPGQTPATNPPLNPIAGDTYLNTADNTEFIHDGTNWIDVTPTATVLDGGNFVQDNTGNNIPVTPVDPTVVAAPISGDQVQQIYDNGVITSTYNGTTWEHVVQRGNTNGIFDVANDNGDWVANNINLTGAVIVAGDAPLETMTWNLADGAGNLSSTQYGPTSTGHTVSSAGGNSSILIANINQSAISSGTAGNTASFVSVGATAINRIVANETILRGINGTTSQPFVFEEATANGTDGISMRAPLILAADSDWILPADAPAPGEVLTVQSVVGTDAQLEWGAPVVTGTNVHQDNTGGDVPVTLVDPTVIAAPNTGDQVVQAYDDGQVISTFNGTTWDNVRTQTNTIIQPYTAPGGEEGFTYINETGDQFNVILCQTPQGFLSSITPLGTGLYNHTDGNGTTTPFGYTLAINGGTGNLELLNDQGTVASSIAFPTGGASIMEASITGTAAQTQVLGGTQTWTLGANDFALLGDDGAGNQANHTIDNTGYLSQGTNGTQTYIFQINPVQNQMGTLDGANSAVLSTTIGGQILSGGNTFLFRGNAAPMELQLESSPLTNYFGLEAAAGMANTNVYTLPASVGAVGEVLSIQSVTGNDAVLAWAAGGGANTNIIENSITQTANQTQTIGTFDQVFSLTDGLFRVSGTNTVSGHSILADFTANEAIISSTASDGANHAISVNNGEVNLTGINPAGTNEAHIIVGGVSSNITLSGSDVNFRPDPLNATQSNRVTWWAIDGTFAAFRAPTTYASNQFYSWPGDTPAPGEVLTVTSIAGLNVGLEWAPAGGAGTDFSVLTADYTSDAVHTQTINHAQIWNINNDQDWAINNLNTNGNTTNVLIDQNGVSIDYFDNINNINTEIGVINTSVTLRAIGATTGTEVSVQQTGDLQIRANDVFLQPDAVSPTASNRLRFVNTTGNYFSWAAPATLPGNRFYTWPSDAPVAGDVLTITAVGGTTATTEWAPAGGGAAGGGMFDVANEAGTWAVNNFTTNTGLTLQTLGGSYTIDAENNNFQVLDGQIYQMVTRADANNRVVTLGMSGTNTRFDVSEAGGPATGFDIVNNTGFEITSSDGAGSFARLNVSHITPEINNNVTDGTASTTYTQTTTSTTYTANNGVGQSTTIIQDPVNITLNPHATGEVIINGKLNVTGLIDPTGLILTEQVSNPGDALGMGDKTIWIDDANGDLRFGTTTNITQGSNEVALGITAAQVGLSTNRFEYGVDTITGATYYSDGNDQWATIPTPTSSSKETVLYELVFTSIPTFESNFVAAGVINGSMSVPYNTTLTRLTVDSSFPIQTGGEVTLRLKVNGVTQHTGTFAVGSVFHNEVISVAVNAGDVIELTQVAGVSAFSDVVARIYN